jgi:hypothetical protein
MRLLIQQARAGLQIGDGWAVISSLEWNCDPLMANAHLAP